MTIRDLPALSPLLTQYINPCLRFELDMDARIPIEKAALTRLIGAGGNKNARVRGDQPIEAITLSAIID
jgi:hypothetical protein